MGLERVALGEPGVADLALVGLLPGVDAEVPLQLEGVRGGVGAVRALGNLKKSFLGRYLDKRIENRGLIFF